MGAPRSRSGLRRMPASCGPWPAGRWLSRSPLVDRPRMLDVSVRRGRGTVQAVLQLEEDPHPGPCAAPAPMPSSPPLPLHRRTTPPPSHLALGDPTRRCCHACGPCVTSRGSRSGASDDETSGMDAGAWPCACRLRNLGGEPTVAPSAPRSCLLGAHQVCLPVGTLVRRMEVDPCGGHAAGRASSRPIAVRRRACTPQHQGLFLAGAGRRRARTAAQVARLDDRAVPIPPRAVRRPDDRKGTSWPSGGSYEPCHLPRLGMSRPARHDGRRRFRRL